ncbi:MAG: hypothetical protein AABZ60_18000 [Planctomycetota bacterium]
MDHEFEIVPVPKILYSDYLNKTFQNCLICDCALTEEILYKVQKAYSGTECLMEAAICFHCMEEMMKEMSKESQENLTRYFHKVKPLGENYCELCQKEIKSTDKRVLGGICQGPWLVHPMEYLCEDCLLKAQELLSEKTRDYRQRFREHHFPGIPTEGIPVII